MSHSQAPAQKHSQGDVIWGPVAPEPSLHPWGTQKGFGACWYWTNGHLAIPVSQWQHRSRPVLSRSAHQKPSEGVRGRPRLDGPQPVAVLVRPGLAEEGLREGDRSTEGAPLTRDDLPVGVRAQAAAGRGPAWRTEAATAKLPAVLCSACHPVLISSRYNHSLPLQQEPCLGSHRHVLA